MSKTSTVFNYGANREIVGKTEPNRLSHKGAWFQASGTFADLGAHIGAGHPWMPAKLDGNQRRCQSNANHAEVLGVDIDSGMTIEQAIAHPFIRQHCGLGIETSSSSPEHNKFRLVSPGNKKHFTGIRLKPEPDDSSSLALGQSQARTIGNTPVQAGIAEQLGTMPVDPPPSSDTSPESETEIALDSEDFGDLIQLDRPLSPAIAANIEPPLTVPTPTRRVEKTIEVDSTHTSKIREGDWVTVEDGGESIRGQVIQIPSAVLHFWRIELDGIRRVLIPENDSHRLQPIQEAIA